MSRVIRRPRSLLRAVGLLASLPEISARELDFSAPDGAAGEDTAS